MRRTIGRRRFAATLAAGGALTMLPPGTSSIAQRGGYGGPNVIIVRFGGGVRRRETIDPLHTYSPYLLRGLAPGGVLFRDMRIADREGVVTSHGEGTLYLLTGKYEAYQDKTEQPLRTRFEASVPTLFEYARKALALRPHEALLINGEDRPDEEFFTFGSHRLFGLRYRSEVLSLYRFKTYLLRQKIAAGEGSEKDLADMMRQLEERQALDVRRLEVDGQVPEIEAFWAKWRRFYGDGGFVNPRGDRLLTELAIRALGDLQPRLMMINYQDPDYVHWGNASHYFRGITVIDQGLQALVAAVDADPFYRDRTVFVVVPDCGRDSNLLMEVPFQHHFNSRSAREIWALLWGPGIRRGVLADGPVDQISIAPTIGRVMGFETPFAEAPPLQEALA